MTAAEIAETLTNGNIADAREAIIGAGYIDSAVLTLDVLEELTGWDDNFTPKLLRLRRCLTGGT